MDRQEMRDYLHEVFVYNILSHYGDKTLNHEDSLLKRIVITISVNEKRDEESRKCKTYVVRSKIRSTIDEVKVDYTFLVNDEMLDVFLNDVLDLDVDSTKFFDCVSNIVEEDFSSDGSRPPVIGSRYMYNGSLYNGSYNSVRVFVIDDRWE